MNKGKEIEEMIGEMARAITLPHLFCEKFKDCKECIASHNGFECEHYKTARRLIVSGYRKADEVRKETAKEILDLLIRYDDGDSNSEAIKLIIDHYALQEYIEVDE